MLPAANSASAPTTTSVTSRRTRTAITGSGLRSASQTQGVAGGGAGVAGASGSDAECAPGRVGPTAGTISKSTESRQVEAHRGKKAWGFGGCSMYPVHSHQHDLAKNPSGHCGNLGCGVPGKLSELQMGEKAKLPGQIGFHQAAKGLPSRSALSYGKQQHAFLVEARRGYWRCGPGKVVAERMKRTANLDPKRRPSQRLSQPGVTRAESGILVSKSGANPDRIAWVAASARSSAL